MLRINRFGKTLSALVLAVIMTLSLTACGGNDTPKKTSKTVASSSTTTVPTTEQTTATTLFRVTGTLAPNDEEIKWEEVPLEAPTVKYVNVNEGFLKVRKGPGKDYEAVAALSKNMAVTVVAKTTTEWYKTDDGFYVSAEYLSDTKI